MYEGYSKSSHTHTYTHIQIIIIPTAEEPNLRNYLYKYTSTELTYKVYSRTDFLSLL